jgi:hypothetical protein
MIHYHGSPISGKESDALHFYRGRHGLVSFANPGQIAVIADVCQSFVLDNGAFSVWRKGGSLDVDGYIQFVELWHKHPGFDWAIIPDVIEGTEGENDQLIANWPRKMNGVPVWHLHESIERLVRLCRDFATVAFGSSGMYGNPGSSLWWVRMHEAFFAICDEQGRPPCKIHGLRMLDPEIFTRLPFASADSCNAAINAGSEKRFGMYPAPTTGTRGIQIAERIEAFNSCPVWENHDAQELLFETA